MLIETLELWTCNLSDITVYEGEKAELICEVIYEDAEVTWLVNDENVGYGDPYEIVSDGRLRKFVILKTG